MFEDPLAALVDYGKVLTGQDSPEAFVTKSAGRACSDAESTRALELLKLNTHLLSAFTSCAWFFADPTGVETLLSLRHAAVVLEIAERALDLELGAGFLERLELVRSNLGPTITGRDLWTCSVEPLRVDAGAMAAMCALECTAGSIRHSTRLGAWTVTADDAEIGDCHVHGTVVVGYGPTLRRTFVEIQAECAGAVGAVARSRLAGEDKWREMTLADAAPDVIARVANARLTGRAGRPRPRALSADGGPAYPPGRGRRRCGSRRARGRRVPTARARPRFDPSWTQVLRDASVSEESLAALGTLSALATATSVEWPSARQAGGAKATRFLT